MTDGGDAQDEPEWTPVYDASAGGVLRALVLGLTMQVRTSGGEASPSTQRLLSDLQRGAQRHEARRRRRIAAESSIEDSEDESSASVARIASNPSVPVTETIELTVAEAAERVGCKPDRIRKLYRSDKVNGRRVGQRVLLIDQGSLDDYFRGAYDQALHRGDG